MQKIVVDMDDNSLKSCLWGIVQEELDIYISCAITILRRGTHSHLWHEARSNLVRRNKNEARDVFASQSTLGAPCFIKKAIGLFPSVPGKAG